MLSLACASGVDYAIASLGMTWLSVCSEMCISAWHDVMFEMRLGEQ